MSWFKIDDAFWAHPKILMLTPEAIALWVRAGSWCSQQLTDGRVAPHVLPMFLATPHAIDELVAADLWHDPSSTCDDCTDIPAVGYLFHDWDEYQRSREEVLADRAANRERQKRARIKAKEKRDRELAESNGSNDSVSHGDRNGVTPPVTDGVSHAERNGPPDPTRPDPVTTSNEVVVLGADRPDVKHLCELLQHLIVENGSKRPAIGKTWLDAARLMLDVDGRDAHAADRLMRWVQADSFWKANVMSMSTFRAKYDQLRLAANAEQEGRKGSKPSKGQQILDVVQLGRRMQADADRKALTA